MNKPLHLNALRHASQLWLLACALCALTGYAQTPQYMTYQGYLTDQNGTALGTNAPQNYDIVFRIWNQPAGGSASLNLLYGELQTVTVVNGYFSVLLGQGTAYVNGGATDPRPPLSTVFTTNNVVSAARYIEMTVKGLNNGADVTILPRLQLVSAPYAFMAANANSLVSPTTGNTLISSSGTNVIINGSVAANSVVGNLTDLGGSIYLDNSQLILAKNSAGTYENCFYPRWSDNVTYLNYGSGGFNIRNDSSISSMWMSPNGNVGIGTTSPINSLGYPGGWNGFHANSGAGNNGLGIIEGSVSARLHLRNDSGTPNFTQDFVVDDGANEVNFRWLGGELGNRVNIMTFNQNGNVGINTTTPQRLLTVSGPGVSPGSDATYQAGIGSGADQLILGYDTVDDVGVIAASDYLTAWKNVVLAPDGGNVGIGTLTPGAPLHVYSGSALVSLVDSPSTIGTWSALRNTSSGGTTWQMISSGSGNGEGAGKLLFTYGAPGEVNGEPMVLQQNGSVGINTSAPGYPLEVDSWENYDLGGGFWYAFQSGSGIAGGGSHVNSISIKAEEGIQSGSGLYVTSDHRIKKNLKKSDPGTDFDLLNRLQVTDYNYIDTVTYGDQRKKGLIAQEVEKVFPQAVTKHDDVVPDIYQPATCKDGWVELATDLKKGERVRLIAPKEDGIHEVLEVATNKFRTDFKPAGDQLFVFGRQVNDFRAVDYNAISVLNVSATQELAKRLEQKSREVAALEQEVADLKKTVMQLAADARHVKVAESSAPLDLPARAGVSPAKPLTTASLEH
ncbi:MAG: tail fiber domain-containing protein [Verrucomicrobiota bacterium]